KPLSVFDRQTIDDHLAIGGGRVTFGGVGLRVTAGFEITAGSAHAVLINVSTIVITFHAAVPGDKLYGEDVAQLIIGGQNRPGVAILVNKQFCSFQSEYDHVIVRVVNLAGDHVRFNVRAVSDGLSDLHRVRPGGGGPTGF